MVFEFKLSIMRGELDALRIKNNVQQHSQWPSCHHKQGTYWARSGPGPSLPPCTPRTNLIKRTAEHGFSSSRFTFSEISRTSMEQTSCRLLSNDCRLIAVVS